MNFEWKKRSQDVVSAVNIIPVFFSFVHIRTLFSSPFCVVCLGPVCVNQSMGRQQTEEEETGR